MEFIVLTTIAAICLAVIVAAGECREIFVPFVLLTYVAGIAAFEIGEIASLNLIGVVRTTILFNCLCIEALTMAALLVADRQQWILAAWGLVMITTCIIGVALIYC